MLWCITTSRWQFCVPLVKQDVVQAALGVRGRCSSCCRAQSARRCRPSSRARTVLQRPALQSLGALLVALVPPWLCCSLRCAWHGPVCMRVALGPGEHIGSMLTSQHCADVGPVEGSLNPTQRCQPCDDAAFQDAGSALNLHATTICILRAMAAGVDGSWSRRCSWAPCVTQILSAACAWCHPVNSSQTVALKTVKMFISVYTLRYT